MTANGQQPFAYERLILVVASAYDSFLFEEEGTFSDRLLTRYRELDLSISSAPQRGGRACSSPSTRSALLTRPRPSPGSANSSTPSPHCSPAPALRSLEASLSGKHPAVRSTQALVAARCSGFD